MYLCVANSDMAIWNWSSYISDEGRSEENNIELLSDGRRAPAALRLPALCQLHSGRYLASDTLANSCVN